MYHDNDDTPEMRNCLQCGQAFEPDDKAQFFCCVDCNEKYQSIHMQRAFVIYNLMLLHRLSQDELAKTDALDMALLLVDEIAATHRKEHQPTRFLPEDDAHALAVSLYRSLSTDA